MPVALLQIYDRVIPNNSLNTLTLFAIGLLVVLILEAVFNIGGSYITGWSAARLQHVLGVGLVRHLLDANLNAVEGVAPGVLLQRLRAIDTIKSFYAGQAMLAAIDVPEGPANVCFGGDDYRTLFITARTSLYSVRMKHAGARPKAAK